MERPYDIFLIHAKEDIDVVRDLYVRLSDEGFSSFLDEECIDPGKNWDKTIREAIRSAQLVLACLSHTAITKRGFINRELREAQRTQEEYPDGSTYLIPVIVAPFPAQEMPDLLKTLQWADVTAEGGYERLLSTVRRALGYAQSELMKRAHALFHGYVVRLRVLDHLDQPIPQASAELNFIKRRERCFGLQKLELPTVEFIGELPYPKLTSRSMTDEYGDCYFAVPHDLEQELQDEHHLVVSATAPRYTVVHSESSWSREVLISIVPQKYTNSSSRSFGPTSHVP